MYIYIYVKNIHIFPQVAGYHIHKAWRCRFHASAWPFHAAMCKAVHRLRIDRKKIVRQDRIELLVRSNAIYVRKLALLGNFISGCKLFGWEAWLGAIRFRLRTLHFCKNWCVLSDWQMLSQKMPTTLVFVKMLYGFPPLFGLFGILIQLSLAGICHLPAQFLREGQNLVIRLSGPESLGWRRKSNGFGSQCEEAPQFASERSLQ